MKLKGKNLINGKIKAESLGDDCVIGYSSIIFKNLNLENKEKLNKIRDRMSREGIYSSVLKEIVDLMNISEWEFVKSFITNQNIKD